MTSPLRRRRLIDRGVAAALAVVVVAGGLVLYHVSDIRNAALVTGSVVATPAQPTTAPTVLSQKWSAATDPALGAVVSPSGVVVTTDQHAITARDAITGAVRWRYSRSNRALCAVGSGDVDTRPFDPVRGFLTPDKSTTDNGSVRGIATVYEENGFCSQVMTFDPVTGGRSKVRTSPNEEHGSLVFGGAYAGWLGADRAEVWRFDLVRSIQYGTQLNPPKPNVSRLGCIFTDMALADTQFATVEHCAAEGANARVVLNFDDPGGVAGHPDGWDNFQHPIRVDINTGAVAARIVGVTADRVAALVSGPTPAVVVWDAAGRETSRTPVSIPAAAVVAADSVSRPATATPSVQTDSERYSLVGGRLLAISTPTVRAVAPPTTLSTSASTTATSAGSAISALTSAPLVDIADLKVDWVASGALGLPATVGSKVLMPTARGLATFDSSTGPSALGAAATATIPVDRGGYTGRVDVSAVGPMIIEDRGATVVALR